MLRAQAGDREAWDALLKRIQTPLFGYVQSLVTETALAEDVLQEVFLRIFRKLHLLPKLNHLLQTAQTGAFSEYAKIEEALAPGVLKLVTDWLASLSGIAVSLR